MSIHISPYLLAICTFIALFTLGCESSALTKAKELNTVGAYDNCLQEYPDGKLHEQAVALREAAYFNDVKAVNSIQSYQLYLRQYPHGQYSSLADSVVRMRTSLLKSLQSPSALEQIKMLASIDKGISGFLDVLRGSGHSELVNIRNDVDFSKYFSVFDNLYLTSNDIVVTNTTTGDCSSIRFIGTICDEKIYAGEVEKNDIVYRTGNYIRTIHSEKDLAKVDTNPGSSLKNWHSKLLDIEAYGDIRPFLQEHRSVRQSDLFHKGYSVPFAESYVPTRLSKTGTNVSGGILGFIQDHPIASLVVGAAAYTAAHSLKSAPQSSSSSSSASSSNQAEAEAVLRSCRSNIEAAYALCRANCENLPGSPHPMTVKTYPRERCLNECRLVKTRASC